MKTIEERAMWYQRGYLNTSPQYKPTLYNAYIVGAIEQREIDIQRACEILRKTDYFKNEEGISEATMEEQFIQAMKGV